MKAVRAEIIKYDIQTSAYKQQYTPILVEHGLMLDNYHLYLFFTRDNSLSTWINTGTLTRESRTYKELAPNFSDITFVTYGGKNDLTHAKEIGGIKIRCNKYGLHPRIYAPILAKMLPRLWPGPAIFKSNQVLGAEVMISAARAAGALAIARAGFLPSNIAIWERGYDSKEAKYMLALEKEVFSRADRVILTTREMADTVISRYGIEMNKISIIPNYVDTDVFKPLGLNKKSNRLVYVGRLHKGKNLQALFEALKGLDLELVLIGEGDFRKQLEEKAKVDKLTVKFMGTVPNHQIPDIIGSAQAFIFPSLGEHHPKALLEAMSCGAAVIACSVPGVRQLIEHGRTGWLCGTTAPELGEAIEKVMADESLRKEMGQAACRYCHEEFNLSRVVKLELDLYRELVE